MAIVSLHLLSISPQFNKGKEEKGEEGTEKGEEGTEKRDFPGGPVAKTPLSQCRGLGFNPSSEN